MFLTLRERSFLKPSYAISTTHCFSSLHSIAAVHFERLYHFLAIVLEYHAFSLTLPGSSHSCKKIRFIKINQHRLYNLMATHGYITNCHHKRKGSEKEFVYSCQICEATIMQRSISKNISSFIDRDISLVMVENWRM